MFYTIYDVLNFQLKKQGMDEKRISSELRKLGVRAEQIKILKQSSSFTSVTQDTLNVILQLSGLTKLEMNLMLGQIPQEYESIYYGNISILAQLLSGHENELKQERKKSPKKLKASFRTDRGQLYHADCMDILPNIASESVDMIFADPPFNLKKEYGNGQDDDLSVSQYINWSKQWLNECVRILKPGGALYVYNIPKWCVYYAEHLNLSLTFQNWIAIDMKNSFPIKDKFTPSHYGLLYYTKGEKAKTFNKQRLPIQTCRHCGGEFKDYGGYKNKMNKAGVNIADVWYDIYPVRNGKNRPYNELSVKLLDRIVSFSSNENELILDPFGGSGTTYAVAELLGRRWIGIELGNCELIENRIQNPEKDMEALNKIQQGKNILFTEKSIKLRKKNGFWLPKGE